MELLELLGLFVFFGGSLIFLALEIMNLMTPLRAALISSTLLLLLGGVESVAQMSWLPLIISSALCLVFAPLIYWAQGVWIRMKEAYKKRTK